MTAPTTSPAPSLDDLDPLRAVRPEIGRPGNIQVVYSTRGERQWQPRYADPNPILRFPYSVQTFDMMARTDDQIDAVRRAITLPIFDATWDLEAKGVKADVVSFVRREIGLPKPGEALPPRRRGEAGIDFEEHLKEALDYLLYGFMPFEQTYSVTVPGDPGHPDSSLFADRPAVHLRKLAARAPATIHRIRLDQDGGLRSIIQLPPDGEPEWFTRPDGELGIEIPVDRLVMYVNERKGGDWTGVSILRSAYRPWKLKERFCWLDGVAADRNSLGIPVVHYDETRMNEDQALAIATQARAGAEAGIALPAGSATIEFQGVTGTVPDLTPKIAANNESIGRASLAMFLNLGHDNGARALGDTFLGFFTRAEQATARDFAKTFTEHVIRDLVEWNFGPDEPYPRLIADGITAETSLPPDALGALVTAKILTPDDLLEKTIRTRYRLPAMDKSTARNDPAPKETTPTTDSGEPLQPADPSKGNPFKPADTPTDQQQPGGKQDPAAQPADQKKPPAGDGKDMADDGSVPDGYTRVGSYVRRLPATLEGYAAFLAAQATEPLT